jgi:hypothetical protein
MSSIDLKNNITISNALNIATISTNTTTVGNEIDTVAYQAATVNFKLGTRNDGNYLPVITECDTSGGTFTAVDSSFLIGTPTALTASNTSQRIGYVGKKRFIKASIISTSVTLGSIVTADVILSSPLHLPTA